MERTLKPLYGYEDMKEAIEKAGAWFIGSFMLEFVDNYEKFQDRTAKKAYIEYFMKEYDVVTDDINQLRNRINLAIRIIESGMVIDAMEFVLNTNDDKIGCDESKVNAKYLLECLKNGESVLPDFVD
ncbi:MAG: hypothetical protein E7253_00820 [Lachnospiraceae bacterium]|nr:hypothetical protein [Lachnospiraceae bacterium]